MIPPAKKEAAKPVSKKEEWEKRKGGRGRKKKGKGRKVKAKNWKNAIIKTLTDPG